MADSRAEAGKKQDEPEASCRARKETGPDKSKGCRNHPERAPLWPRLEQI